MYDDDSYEKLKNKLNSNNTNKKLVSSRTLTSTHSHSAKERRMMSTKKNALKLFSQILIYFDLHILEFNSLCLTTISGYMIFFWSAT